MALSTFARRLQRTAPHLFLPLILHSITNPSFIPPPSKHLHFFSRAFYQTLVAASHTLQPDPHFSTLQFFSTQNLYDPIDFSNRPNETLKSLEPGLLQLLKKAKEFPSESEAISFLDESGIKPNPNLVCSTIWALRDEWRLAFLVFKWGEKWGGCSSEEAWSFMIWVLGNNKKFNIAWRFICDLRRSSADTRRPMLIMIDRYAAANDPGKAIRTFHIMEKFRMSPDVNAFYTLLSVLCKHGNIEEAEELMLQNKKFFPLETEGFNIILNGWCNISVDVFEAKRVCREMSKCCVTPNATTYTYMISCFSKVGNLFDSLRLYDEMKKRGWVPGREVYNSLIYVLTHENCLREALKILKKMKEAGLQPDCVSYNSIIRPLCEAKRLEEARTILAAMIGDNLSPTVETYHAFLEEVSFGGTLEVLSRMKKAGFGPTGNTFLLILGKFFKLEQPENALKIWLEMEQYGVEPNSAHYTVLVQGLATCGWLIKAREFYAEMRSNGFLEDPKLTKLLKEKTYGNRDQRKGRMRPIKRATQLHHRKDSMMRWKKRRYQSRKKTSLEKSNLTL